jgi:hypothetical protein
LQRVSILPLVDDVVFWGAWIVAFLHAVWRTAAVRAARLAPAWSEQSWMIAGLAVLAVISNWLTTGDHLLRTIGSGYWPVAGVDLVLVLVAVIATIVARRLQRRAAVTAEAAGEAGQDVASEALLSSVIGFAWLALAMDVYWRQAVKDAALTRRSVFALRTAGAVALALSPWLCLQVDHASMASLVWVMSLAAAALTVTFTLSWRPHWLAVFAMSR